MPQKIYYWKGCVNQSNFADYQKTVEQLLFGDYRSADLDLKKLKNTSRVYTARINDADRLLFKTLVVNGEPQMLLLDVIVNHDYAKSKYFRRHVSSFETDTIALDEVLFTSRSHGKRADNDYTLIPVHDYNQQFITFNSEQEEALSVSLPLLLSGPPGSGKTCVAMALLNQLAECRTASKKILYVTESERLAHCVQKMWNGMSAADGVEFLSYTEMLAKLESTGARQVVTRDDFEIWFPRYIQQLQTTLKGLKQPVTVCNALTSISIKQIYQECRILSGYTKEEYLTIGKRASLFRDLEIRKVLFQAMTAYLAKLKNEGCIHPAFHRPAETAVYDAIVVDEAQDFSLLQLDILHRLTTASKISYNLDSNQSLNDSKSRKPFLERLFFNEGKTLSPVYLTGTYRCPHLVIHFANALLRLRDTLRGGASEKGDVTTIQCSPDPAKAAGLIHWVDPTISNQAGLQDYIQTIPNFFLQCAVITSEEYKTEAKQVLNTSLVFTAEEIKGLEYPSVLLYRPLDRPIFKDANKKLTSMTVLSEASSHLSCQDDDLYSEFFNQIFTASTRATENLIIYQANDPHGLGAITDYLRRYCSLPSPQDSATQTTPEPPQMPVTERDAQCLREVKRLLDNGNDEQAHQLFLMQLAGRSEQDYQLFKGQYLDQASHASISPIPTLPTNDPLLSASYLLTHFTHENVIKLLNRTDAVPSLYQWETISNVHNQLIFHIFNYKRRADIFFEALKITLERDENNSLRTQLKTCFDPATGGTIMHMIVASLHLVDAKSILYQLRIRGEIPLDLLNCRDRQGETLLHALLRVRNENTEHYNKLINRGVNINLVGNDGVSPLLFATYNGYPHLIKLLLEKGADANQADNKGITPLCVIISRYPSDDATHQLVELLLNHGANVNFTDRRCSGNSALILSMAKPNRKAFTLLLQRGADVNQKNVDGMTPLDLAIALNDQYMIYQIALYKPKPEAHTAEFLKAFQSDRNDSKSAMESFNMMNSQLLTCARVVINRRRQQLMNPPTFFSAQNNADDAVVEHDPSLTF